MKIIGVDIILRRILSGDLERMSESEKSEAIRDVLREEEEEEYMKALIFLAFVISPKGQQAIKTLQPFIIKLLDILERSCCSMFQAAAANPVLAAPATILFTNLANRLYLIDGPTAMVINAAVGGITATESIVDIIEKVADMFKPIRLGESKTTAIVYSLGAGVQPYPIVSVPA